MLTRTDKRTLLRDMSAAEMELNTVLQFIGHAASQGIFGKGHRRRSIDAEELLEQLALE